MEYDVIGLDVGHGRTKCCAAAADGSMQSFSFMSVAKTYRETALGNSARAFAHAPTVLRVSVGEDKYEVDTDPNALPFTTVGERNEGEDFPERAEYAALVYAALMKVQAHRVKLLVLGLPVHLLGKFAASLVKQFTGAIHYSPTTPRVWVDKVAVLPQPLGSLIALRATNHMTIDSPSTMIIDAGWGTLDWLTARTNSFKLDLDRSGGGPGAGALIYRQIAGMLATQHDMRFDGIDQIDHAIRNRKPLQAHGRSIDLGNYPHASKGLAIDAIRKIRARLGSVEDLGIVLTGGTCWLFKDAVQEVFPHTKIQTMNDPLLGNANGFALGGLQSLRKLG